MTPAQRTRQCPDCTGEFVDAELRHEDCCPVGVDVDATMADDREWFEAHPFTKIRRRPPTFSERVMLCLTAEPPLPLSTKFSGRVEVLHVADGMRLKRFGGTVAIIPRSDL